MYYEVRKSGRETRDKKGKMIHKMKVSAREGKVTITNITDKYLEKMVRNLKKLMTNSELPMVNVRLLENTCEMDWIHPATCTRSSNFNMKHFVSRWYNENMSFRKHFRLLRRLFEVPLTPDASFTTPRHITTRCLWNRYEVNRWFDNRLRGDY